MSLQELIKNLQDKQDRVKYYSEHLNPLDVIEEVLKVLKEDFDEEELHAECFNKDAVEEREAIAKSEGFTQGKAAALKVIRTSHLKTRGDMIEAIDQLEI